MSFFPFKENPKYLDLSFKMDVDFSNSFGGENTLICIGIGTLETSHFPFVPHGKLIVLGVPIFKQIRVTE